MKRLTVSLALMVASVAAQAKVTLPEQISDNMVLQQQSEARLWGWAKAGATVQITTSWNAPAVSVQADSKGKWVASVKTPAASYAPQTLTISDGEPVTLKDVLIGEVWFASGQSNMDMPLDGYWNCPIEGGNQTIATAGQYKGKIRFATLAHSGSFTPQDKVTGTWKDCNAENARWFGATAFYFAENLQRILDVPVGIMNSAWGGSRVEGWLPAEVLKTYPGEPYTEQEIVKQQQEYLRSEIMYNGVLHPVIGYTVKGFIWYQGCSNVSSSDTYADRFAQMITLWRQWWGQGDLPFYYVEVAPYNYGEGTDVGAILREAQYKTQFMVPNAAMVCTNDLVSPWEVNQIHPKNKQDVGRRLSYLALNNTYGFSGIRCKGPEYQSMEVKDGKAIVTFRYADEGFSRMQDVEGFEICGSDKQFVKAQVQIDPADRRNLIISSPKVPQPVAVRYAFHNFSPGNMANIHGLPVVPFRTDK